MQAEKIIAEDRNNPSIPRDLPEDCLKAIFESDRTRELFTAYFDVELYRYAANYYDNHLLRRNRPMYAVCGVTKVLEDVEISKRNRELYQDIKCFLEQELSKISRDKDAQIISKFKKYFTARIDIRLMSTEGDFQILSVSDDKATIWKPGWFNKDGIGYQIQSYAGDMEIVAKATVNGQINLSLRGLDMRNPEDKSKFIPYWIDYTKLTVNGELIFDKLTPAWHDKSFRYSMDAKAGQEIKIKVEWLPHRSDS